MIKLISAGLGILLGTGCAVVAVFASRIEGPKIESALVAVMLLGSAGWVFAGGSPKYLTASYGILVGILAAWGEFLFLVSSKGPIASPVLGVEAGVWKMLALLTIPLVGLVLSLIASRSA